MTFSLINNIQKHVSLSALEIERIGDVVRIKKINRKDFLVQEREICKNLSYIQSGCLKIYKTDSEGIKHTIFFTLEDWWAMDLKSFVSSTPARFYIEALEDCEVHQISKKDFNRLLEEIPKLEKWFRILLQNALIASEDRIDSKLSLNAEARYIEFLKKYPTLESRIPQKQIASYLGITPEFLSKLKAKKWKEEKS